MILAIWRFTVLFLIEMGENGNVLLRFLFTYLDSYILIGVVIRWTKEVFPFKHQLLGVPEYIIYSRKLCYLPGLGL